MKKHSAKSEIGYLLKLVDEAYNRKAWHGPNLRGSVRGITMEEASWRPSPNRHNIWEIIVHCAYWKYIVRRRLLGEKKGSFPLKGSNWFKRSIVLIPEAFEQDLLLLEETHAGMRHVIHALQPALLKRILPKSKVNNETMIRGIAMHDLYHAGQIQLLKRLMK